MINSNEDSSRGKKISHSPIAQKYRRYPLIFPKMIFFHLTILLLILYGQNKKEEVQSKINLIQLLPFEGVNNKWGYIDKTGKIVISPQFDYAGVFSQGRAAVGIAGKFGYIDKTGKIVIDLQFTDAGDFSEGLAPVMITGIRGVVKEGMWIRFGTSSRRKNPQVWNAPRQVGCGIGGYIDKNGKFVINPQFDYAEEFSEGLAVVANSERVQKSGDDGKYMSMGIYPVVKAGYIDKTGRRVIDLVLREAGKFSEGLALVGHNKRSGLGDTVDGFINKSGEVVLSLDGYDRAGSFSEGLAMVSKGEKYGYINKTGKLGFGLVFDDAGNFSEGLAPVNVGAKWNWKVGLIGGKWGYIDKTGKRVIDLQFDNAFEFVNGLAVAEKDGRCWYIDKTGKFIPQPE